MLLTRFVFEGLDQNYSEINLNSELCIVSILFMVDDLPFIKRKEQYSNSDNMNDVYICLRNVDLDPQDV